MMWVLTFVSFLGHVKRGCHDQVVFNIRWNVSINEELHHIVTRKSGVHAKEVANGSGVDRLHRMLRDINLVVF